MVTPSPSVLLVQKLLANTANPAIITEIVAPDATYISLSFSDPPLKKIMPWCGTHQNAGPSAIIETFANVARHWENKAFETQSIFGGLDHDGIECVAAFGSMTYEARRTGITKTSPWAVWCKIKVEKVVYMQFMEDTFCTASTFEVAGEKKYHADPDGGEAVL